MHIVALLALYRLIKSLYVIEMRVTMSPRLCVCIAVSILLSVFPGSVQGQSGLYNPFASQQGNVINEGKINP